jgi:KDO2-lipid IV(A) lauroyltransferase
MQFWAMRGLIGIFRRLSLRQAVRFGATLGRLFYWVDRRHQKVAHANLQRALGAEKNDAALQEIAVGAFMSLGRAVAEISRAEGMSDAQILEAVEFEGLAHYRKAQALGRGIIILTGHFGNWEWLATGLALNGHPIHVVARPLDNPYLDRLICGWRERGGNHVLNKHTASAEIIRLLRQGEGVGFLLDQNTRREDAVFVDYFGTPAATNKGLAIIALRTGAPVLPIFFVREGERRRVIIEAPLSLHRTGVLQTDILDVTALFTQKIESYVRRYPDHWTWIHRRWKTRPPEEGKR